MSRVLTEKRTPRFDIINRHNVAIASLRNQLRNATGIDELTAIAGKIIDFENKVLLERSAGYKQLEDEKKRVEEKMDRLKRDLEKTITERDLIANALDNKLNGYKKTLQNKIDLLTAEYNNVLENMSDAGLEARSVVGD